MQSSKYLERLGAIGLRPEDIDFVMCTHFHPDHVGWNTRLENGVWVPTFTMTRKGVSYAMADVKFPVRDHSGKIVAVGGIGLDITELKKRESELAELVDKLKAANAREQAAHALQRGQTGEHNGCREPLELPFLDRERRTQVRAGEEGARTWTTWITS